ncbi:MAG: DUF2306 domain-containing protein [Pseudomonadota bacterium]
MPASRTLDLRGARNFSPPAPRRSWEIGAAPAASTRWGLSFNAGLRAAFAVLCAGLILFGVYIAVFYGGAALSGRWALWNAGSLPGLYDPNMPLATLGMGAHLFAGAVLMALGPLQFVPAIRQRRPALHRAIGRIYIAFAMLAAIGGLLFVFLKGTVGGLIMDVGATLYGALVIAFGFATIAFAIRNDFARHECWAMRLFALVSGALLYRIEYALWGALTSGAGHTASYDGWFDNVVNLGFYAPALVAAEAYIRTRGKPGSCGIQVASWLATAIIAAGVLLVIAKSWLPRIGLIL